MVEEEQQRPDPDSLLAMANEKPRGRLKVFFGACAGVGKTYAMLQEAQRLRAQGLDVLVGVVETHGRSETAALLDGLTLLPQNASSIAAGWCMNSISTPRWRATRRWC